MSADPRPNTARLPNGRLDNDLEIRFRIIFGDLRALLGSRAASEVGQRSLLERMEAAEQEAAALTAKLKAMDERLEKLEKNASPTP